MIQLGQPFSMLILSSSAGGQLTSKKLNFLFECNDSDVSDGGRGGEIIVNFNEFRL